MDRLDAKIALIARDHRETNIHCCMLFYLLRLAVAQCHSDWYEQQWSEPRCAGETCAAPSDAGDEASRSKKNFRVFAQEMAFAAAQYETDMCQSFLHRQDRTTRKRPSSSPGLARKLQK